MLQEKKFQPNQMYTGVDTPEDQKPLGDIVNGAINDVAALPDPLDKGAVRARLTKMTDDADGFATEDREQVYRYAILIWRAAGFKEESRLFPLSDEKMLAYP